MSTQAVVPDFIPADNSPDFIPLASTPAQKAEQSGAVMRFIKSAAGRLYAGTAGAGPQQSGTMTQDFSQQEAQAKAGTLPSMWQVLKNSASDSSPSNIDIADPLSSLNPIDVQKFQSGDTAGGLGSSLANLLMLRQGFKTRSLPEMGSPSAYAERVQPLTGYTKAQPKPNVILHDVPNYTVTPAQGVPQNLLEQLTRKASGSTGLQGEFPVVPAGDTVQPAQASLPSRPTPNMVIYDDAGMSNSAPAQAKPINKNVNSNVQEYFIQKMRDQMNRQTVTGSAEQDAALQRMNEYAKTPVDKMQGTASGPVESPQYAYRVRDAGDTGIIPKGHAQATTDLSQAQSYLPGRGSAQNAPQELVKVDLSKLDPSEYQIVPGPGGKQWVRFKSAVPESFIEKVGQDEPRVPTSDADMMDLLMKSVQRAKVKTKSAKAGD